MMIQKTDVQESTVRQTVLEILEPIRLQGVSIENVNGFEAPQIYSQDHVKETIWQKSLDL